MNTFELVGAIQDRKWFTRDRKILKKRLKRLLKGRKNIAPQNKIRHG